MNNQIEGVFATPQKTLAKKTWDHLIPKEKKIPKYKQAEKEILLEVFGE